MSIGLASTLEGNFSAPVSGFFSASIDGENVIYLNPNTKNLNVNNCHIVFSVILL